jgi:hypothetical protein
MSLTITDKTGKIIGHWVAKTTRGFNRKQKTEILSARKSLQNGIS